MTKPTLDWKYARRRQIAEELMRTKNNPTGLQCNCDLDRWQPELSTGHSFVCRIHKAATACDLKEQSTGGGGSDG